MHCTYICSFVLWFGTASKRIEEQGLTGVWVNTGGGQPLPHLSAAAIQEGSLNNQAAAVTQETPEDQDKGKDSKIAAIGIKLRR